MKRKTMCVVAAVLMGAMLTACGQEEKPVSIEVSKVSTESEAKVEESKETAQAEESKETAPAESASKETEQEAEKPAESKEETPATESKESEEPKEESGEGYADNFAVDSEAAVDFADKIKEAVAAKDLEALADLTSFPMYAGFADGGVSVMSRDEFIDLGAEKIFTEEMLESIDGADTSGLSASMAGFSLSKSGRPNVIFGVVDGKLAITGMNY